MLDADLRELPLPSPLGFFKPQYFARIVEPNGPGRRRKPGRNSLRDEGCEFGPQSEDIAFAIDEPVDLLLAPRPHTLDENIVVVKDRGNDLVLRPGPESETNFHF